MKKELCNNCMNFLPAEIIEGFEFDDFCTETYVINPKKCDYYRPVYNINDYVQRYNPESWI
jgi:hypothetical protein